MGGLLAEVGEPITRVFDDADGDTGLGETGYGLQITDVTEEVTKCAAGAALYAIAYVDTKNPLYLGDTSLYTEYLQDPEIACIREGEANVQLEPHAGRTTDIHVGDIIAVGPTTAGHFAHWEDNAAQGTAAGLGGAMTLAAWMAARSEICGVAEESIDADEDTDDETLHVRLTIFGDET